MWMLSSLALLASQLVIGSSFPHPNDQAYAIPDVGDGDRAQYYVLHADGTFKYGYDTGEGAFESAKLKPGMPVKGQFGYVDPDGKEIHLEYEAGAGGFVARGEHLPKPSPELAKAIANVVARAGPYIDPLASDFADRSYGFRFDSDAYSRNEESDSDGVIRGSYSYVDEFGHRRSFTYKAGKDIGFVIEGDGLTIDTDDDDDFRRTVQVRTQSIAPQRRVHATRQHTSRSRRPLTKTSAISPVSFRRSETEGDASYSFSYAADDHSRRESSDSNLNVEGSFSFVGDDDETRSVNYRAGSGTGFEAKGDHLPAPPADNFGTRTASRKQTTFSTRRTPTRTSVRKTKLGVSSQTQRGQTQTFTQPQVTSFRVNQQTQRGQTQTYSSPPFTSFGIQRDSSDEERFVSPIRRTLGTLEEANIRSEQGTDGSYSVFYENSDHARFEKGNSDNQVEGSFSFRSDDDDKTRMITYEAGRETGFVVQGEHIPIGPEVPGAPTGQPTGKLVRVRSEPFVDPLADSGLDASYNFGFDSNTYSRSETADSDGNVVGTYTVVNDDGLAITYEFRAGKGIGFETKEVSRTQGPKPEKPEPYRGPLAGDLTSSQQAVSSFSAIGQPVVKTETFSVRPRDGSFEAANIRRSSNQDGSYSFSYGTSSHSRNEQGDSNNRVQGEFTVILDDDEERRVTYRADSESGFVAEGAHFPTGPVVPGASSGQVTGRRESVASTPFVDPLARSSSDSGQTDASYSFSFDSDSYSRSEKADEDGNVEGTYDVQQEDGTIITYGFKAGKGVGFEIEEIGRRSGARPVVKTSSAAARGTSFQTSSAVRSSQQQTSINQRRQQTSFVKPTVKKAGTFSPPIQSFSHRHQARPQVRTSSFSQSSSSPFKPTLKKAGSAGREHFRVEGDDFVLRQYSATDGDKFGYVIRYD